MSSKVYKYVLLSTRISVGGHNIYNITQNTNKPDPVTGLVVLKKGDVFSTTLPKAEWINDTWYRALSKNGIAEEYIEPAVKTKKEAKEEVAEKAQEAVEAAEEVEKKK